MSRRRSLVNPISAVLYRLARASRELRAVERAVTERSAAPLLKRYGRKLVGRGTARITNGWPR